MIAAVDRRRPTGLRSGAREVSVRGQGRAGARKRTDVVELLTMMIHIADDNARTVREARAPRLTLVETREEREWRSFKNRVQRANILGDLDAVEEEDVDQLLAVSELLQGEDDGATVAEIVLALQARSVVSTEFAAAARGQTERYLGKLVDLNRVERDARGIYRWRR